MLVIFRDFAFYNYSIEEILEHVNGTDNLDQLKIREEVKAMLDQNNWESLKLVDWEAEFSKDLGRRFLGGRIFFKILRNSLKKYLIQKQIICQNTGLLKTLVDRRIATRANLFRKV